MGWEQAALSGGVLFFITRNNWLACYHTNQRALRAAFLVISLPSLLLIPLAIDGVAKELSVQFAGAYFAIWLRAVEYFLEDPPPEHRTEYKLFLLSCRDTFQPFDQHGAAVKVDAPSTPSTPSTPTHGHSTGSTKRAAATAGSRGASNGTSQDQGEKQQHDEQPPLPRGTLQLQQQQQQLARQPLVPRHYSAPAAVARLAGEVVLQYLLFDALLVGLLQPLVPPAPAPAAPAPAPRERALPLLDTASDLSPTPGLAHAAAAAGAGLPPLLSATSMIASLAFTVVLYLHFVVNYKAALLLLALGCGRPRLLCEVLNVFREPWRGVWSVSELWLRWHQLFRMTFLRLGYRPARAGVRALARRLGSGSGGGGGGGDSGGAGGVTAGRGGGSGKGGGGSSAAAASAAADVRADGTAAAQAASCPAASAAATPAAAAAASDPPFPALPRAAATAPVAAAGARPPSRLAGLLSRRGVQDAAGVMAVFLLSGTVHEYMNYCAFIHLVPTTSLWHLAFFALHGAGSVADGAVRRGRWFRSSAAWRAAWRAANAAFCVVTCTLFMRPWLLAGFHHDFWHPWSPAAWLAQHIRRSGALQRWTATATRAAGTLLARGGEL